METSNLPQFKRKATSIRKLVFLLSQKFSPLRIYEFSGRSWNGMQEPCLGPNHCLLLITEQVNRIDYQVQDFVNRCYQNGTVTVICHDQQAIGIAIAANSRFFIRSLTYGKLLYSKDGLLDGDPIPPFIPTKAAIKALKHYNHRIPLAEGFLMCASECVEMKQYGICAFMLHQAVEQACICLIRVHIAYRSEFHNLYRLLHLCQCFSEKPFQLFLSTPEDERLFDVMAKSYSGSRYREDFTVSRQDAESLHQRVASFLLLVKEMCNEKIELLITAASDYEVLKNADHVQIENITN